MLQAMLNSVSGMKGHAAILRSPLHRLLNRNLMLITVTGRKSRPTYIVSVSYQRQADVVRVVSERRDRWWRNLRGGAPVTLQLQGREVKGQASMIEEVDKVLPLLTEQVQHSPTIARMLNVKRTDQGQLRMSDFSAGLIDTFATKPSAASIKAPAVTP